MRGGVGTKTRFSVPYLVSVTLQTFPGKMQLLVLCTKSCTHSGFGANPIPLENATGRWVHKRTRKPMVLGGTRTTACRAVQAAAHIPSICACHRQARRGAWCRSALRRWGTAQELQSFALSSAPTKGFSVVSLQ